MVLLYQKFEFETESIRRLLDKYTFRPPYFKQVILKTMSKVICYKPIVWFSNVCPYHNDDNCLARDYCPFHTFLCLSQTLLGRTNNITELYFTSLGSGWYKVIERRPCSLAVRALGMTFLRLVQPLLIGKTFELYFLKSPWFQSW